MDCRLHFKDVFFVSAPWYLQDKKHLAFLRRKRGPQAEGRGSGGGGVGGEGGLCVNQIQWIIFFNVLQRELRIKGLLLPKESEREKKKIQKPTKAVKTFGPSVGAANAKQIGGIFPTTLLKCAAVSGSPSPFAQCVVVVWCISSSELRAASQGPCVLCSDHYILSVHLHNHRRQLQRHIGPLDLLLQKN